MTPITPSRPLPAPTTDDPIEPVDTTPPDTSADDDPGADDEPDATTPPPVQSAPVELDAEAGKLYDPYAHVTASNEAARAIDGNPSTSWFADVAGTGAPAMGYVVDLGAARGIRAVEIATPTPGFKVEIYASDEATPPPDILDTRWAHITDRADVGADGETTRIAIGGGTSEYRTLLLWITAPPTEGRRVRIAELTVEEVQG